MSDRQTEIDAVRAAAASIKKPAANKGKAHSRAPTAFEIVKLPAAMAGVYELNDAEVKRARSRIYSLNRENQFGWRWRTLREGPLLLIWRIH